MWAYLACQQMRTTEIGQAEEEWKLSEVNSDVSCALRVKK